MDRGCSGLPSTEEDTVQGRAKATEGPGSQVLNSVAEGCVKPVLKPIPVPTFGLRSPEPPITASPVSWAFSSA